MEPNGDNHNGGPPGNTPPAGANGGNGHANWVLETKHFHMFWIMIYPRIIARLWYSDVDEEELREIDYRAFVINELRIFQGCAKGKQSRGWLGQLIKSFESMEISLIPGYNFDFVICNKGLALPYVDKPDSAADIFRNYRDRPVFAPLINLPRMDDGLKGLDQECIHIPEKKKYNCYQSLKKAGKRPKNDDAPDLGDINTYIIYLLDKVDWLLRGSLYSALMRAADRVIADAWYEETVREEVLGKLKKKEAKAVREVLQRERRLLLKERLGDPDEAREIFSEYLEESLDGPYRDFVIRVLNLQDSVVEEFDRKEGFSKLTPEGLEVFLPTAPKMNQIIKDMTMGKAGNPMYTNTVDTSGTF